jgi:Methyltransferase domain
MIEGLVFTSDWVTSHEANWRSWLGHLIDRPCLGLEVGVYEGRSSVWFLENVCIHSESELVAIDPWPQKSAANRACIEASVAHRDRYQFWDQKSEPLMARWGSAVDAGIYDFVYLDGGKEAARVLEQSVLAWRLLAPGGTLIWDDYRWTWNEVNGGPKPVLPPAVGIDAFLAAYAPELEEIGRGWQVAVRKG